MIGWPDIEHADKALFAWVNGLAGHCRWLDLCGQYLAVYGLLAVALVALGVAWWPRLEADSRQKYLLGLGIAGLLCAALSGALWLLATHVLHHDLRARPFNSVWTTPLITVETHDGFPAWPLLIAGALLMPARRAAPRAGRALAGLAGLLGLSLIFTGTNFPLDIAAGALLGVMVGQTACVLSGQHDSTRARRALLALWLVLAVGGSSALIGAHAAMRTGRRAPAAPVTVIPPDAVWTPLWAVTPRQPDDPALGPRLTAASNGHLTAAELRIVLPKAQTDIPALNDLARRGVNVVFAHWPQLDLLTVTLAMRDGPGTRARVGTLYTATVARAEWPAGGFTAAQRLPGLKFYQAGLGARRTAPR